MKGRRSTSLIRMKSVDRFTFHIRCSIRRKDRYRLTNEEPDEVRVVFIKKVIQVHEAGESAFIAFGNRPLHGCRLSVCCLKLKIVYC